MTIDSIDLQLPVLFEERAEDGDFLYADVVIASALSMFEIEDCTYDWEVSL